MNKRPRWLIRQKILARQEPYELYVQGKDREVKIADIYNCEAENVALIEKALTEYFDNHQEEYL